MKALLLGWGVPMPMSEGESRWHDEGFWKELGLKKQH